jgi:hypothetical protein
MKFKYLNLILSLFQGGTKKMAPEGEIHKQNHSNQGEIGSGQ